MAIPNDLFSLSMFPYSDFNKVNLDWICDTLKEQQAEIDQLRDTQDNYFVTPEMYGAKGDGTTDDAISLQSAFDSGRIVVLTNKYAVSSGLSINHDAVVVCGGDVEILPLANIGTLISVGTGTVETDNPVLTGLIKVSWYGGKINCKNGSYVATIGIELGKLYHSKFADISIIGVSNTGVKYSGASGALAICENVVVKGVDSSLAEIGFDIRRNDQRLYNCSVVDCKVGFYMRAGYIRLIGCGVWVTHNTNWNLTTGYVVDAKDCGLFDCTADTLWTGVLLSANAKNLDVTNMFWLCATSIVSTYTGMRLFVGADPNNYVSVSCNVIGLQAQEFTQTVYLKRYIANDNNFSINGISCSDVSNIYDASDVVDLQAISNKSKIIGDWYSANMETSPTTANGALTGTMTLPAGRYILVYNSPYVTGLGTGGSACRFRFKVGDTNTGGNYHYIKNGWNEGFSEIAILSNTTEVYLEAADSINHQNNAGSGVSAIRIS